jgi:NAD(P)-dependent dehydrogenase (short-subunit alcohol dehydrogenase family)
VELEGRHVVVTGAGRGIGRALALRFADEGARAVVVSDVDPDTTRSAAEQLGGLGVPADVGREEDIRDLIARAEEANGPIDLFFSNAGITGPSGGPEVLDADWDLLWRVNTMSHVWAARALLPGMLDRGEGYLCSTASAAGLLAQLGAIGYTVTKHGAVAVAEWLSMTYGDRGIRVSCLCPQYVRTPMVTEGELPVDRLEQVATILEPEQVADAVVAGIREERLLILPHPEVGTYMAHRGGDHERWLRGMRRLQGHLNL